MITDRVQKNNPMPKKKTKLDQFHDLTWYDIEEWTEEKIFSRGRNYQRQGRVSDLAVTDDHGLIAWVEGTRRYATKVVMGKGGLLESICTCPYQFDCKHGVAVVIEYLKQIDNNRRVPKARKDDDRLKRLEDEKWDGEPDDDENVMSKDIQKDIDSFLKGKTKAQLLDLIKELARQHPEIAQDLSDRKQITSGSTKTLVARLRKEIRDIGDEPGWQNYWKNEGYTPDYSGIRTKLETLVKAGHVDEVLTLGRELVETGTRQVEESHDEGETEMEVAACMPVIVEALDRSSLDAADKLIWAMDAVLEDQFEVCTDFVGYLHEQHPRSAWQTLSDQLLASLSKLKSIRGATNCSRNYERDRLSNWAIHALEQAGREDEIIPLCIAEARQTGSYDRLVNQLVTAQRYEEAEHWIHKGVLATKEKWPGIAYTLRGKLKGIRTQQQNWPAVAAMQTEEFVRHPSLQTFTECKKICTKARIWPNVRKSILGYLEKGELPWKQKGWSLPESGLDQPDANHRNQFPLIKYLIDIAIFEKKPDQVLKWYDQRPKSRYGWLGLDEDAIANAVQAHAPAQAVSIWKNMAEGLIAQVKPAAYQEATKYLRKAARVMGQGKKQEAWKSYLKALRKKHFRKRRLMEILDGLDENPIVKKRR